MRKLFLVALIVTCNLGMTACTQAQRVSSNLSKEADNFNVIRRLTVINCIQGDVLFSMEGKMSLQVNQAEEKIDIIVENEDGGYSKHFVGLSDNVTYTIEQVQTKNVSNYKFTINYNPKMWFPIEVKTID